MLTRVADEALAAIPEMKEVRRQLLEDAAAFYTELLKLNPRDPRGVLRTWRSLRCCSREYDKVGGRLWNGHAELDPDNARVPQASGMVLIRLPRRCLPGSCSCASCTREMGIASLNPRKHVYQHRCSHSSPSATPGERVTTSVAARREGG